MNPIQLQQFILDQWRAVNAKLQDPKLSHEDFLRLTGKTAVLNALSELIEVEFKQFDAYVSEQARKGGAA